MSIFRRIGKREIILWLWILLLSIVFLFGQSVKFHSHSLDHADKPQPSHQYSEGVEEHTNPGVAHLSIDTSHPDHHTEIASEIDTSQYALLKVLSSKVLTVALLITLLVFFCPGFYQLIVHRRNSNPTINFWRYHFSPPLRAPPL